MVIINRVLNHCAAIYVPVAYLGDDPLNEPPAFFKDLLKDVAIIAGGYTITPVSGGWLASDNSVVHEPVLEVCVWYSCAVALRSGERILNRLRSFSRLLIELGEQEVAIYNDGSLFLYGKDE